MAAKLEPLVDPRPSGNARTIPRSTNRNRIHQLGQGMADTLKRTVSNGHTPDDRTLYQEAGGARGSVRAALPWKLTLAIAGPILAGLVVGMIYRGLRKA